MPFAEEVPVNFKARCECKRRSCPLQDYFHDRVRNKRFFTYRCSDPKIWAVCRRQIEVSDNPAKVNSTPIENEPYTVAQQPKLPTAPQEPAKPILPSEPTKQQIEHRCNQYPYDCWQCSPAQQDKCGVEAAYTKPIT